MLLYLYWVIVVVASPRCTNESSCPATPGCYCINGCREGCVHPHLSPRVGYQCVNATPTDPLLMGTSPYQPDAYSLNGTVCPSGCVLNNGTCQGQNGEQVVCGFETNWKCPVGCVYSEATEECQPVTPNDVCKFIPANLLCPKRCRYNHQLGRCISKNPNYVCELSMAPVCPIGCMANIRGDMCIPTTFKNGRNSFLSASRREDTVSRWTNNILRNHEDAICEQVTQPRCRPGCVFNAEVGHCTSKEGYFPCENLIVAFCSWPGTISLMERYVNDITKLPHCVVNNAIDICYDWDRGIVYPARLQEKYAGVVKCKYSRLSCDITGCWNGSCSPIVEVCCE